MKNNKGITLIALIVTIILMLILAGVVIRLSLGQNGIFDKAKKAKMEHIRAELEEELQIKYSNEVLQVDGNEISFDTFVSTLKEEEYDIPEDSEPYTINQKGYTFSLSFEDNIVRVKIIDEGENEPIIVSSIGDVVNPENIGKEVANYREGETWRIFYQDENFVYIISDSIGYRAFQTTHVVNNETVNYELEDIDVHVRFLNKLWMDEIEKPENASERNNANVRATAYAMDQSVWGTYTNGIWGAYAIPCPTFELAAKSYKASIGADYSAGATARGYNCGMWVINAGPENIYVQDNWITWLASPYNGGAGEMCNMTTSYNEPCWGYGVDRGAFRPVVLIPTSSFNYKIIDVKVPTMTSSTTPSGTASSSTVFSNSEHPIESEYYSAWHCFDKHNGEGHKWASIGNVYDVNRYVQYEFPTANHICKVEITNHDWSTDENPTAFELWASNDGTNWDVLLSQTTITNIATNAVNSFSVPYTEQSYKYYRVCGLSCTSGNTCIGELQFYCTSQ